MLVLHSSFLTTATITVSCWLILILWKQKTHRKARRIASHESIKLESVLRLSNSLLGVNVDISGIKKALLFDDDHPDSGILLSMTTGETICFVVYDEPCAHDAYKPSSYLRLRFDPKLYPAHASA